MAADQKLIAALRKELQTAADSAKAPAMQAYMKSTMPYYGVNSPSLRKITKAVFDAHVLDGVDRWTDTVLKLWRSARFREERYAAIDLTGHKAYRAYQTVAALPIYDEMIVTGAWWDYVDHVGIHRIGPLLTAYPKQMRSAIRRWSTDADLWRRRTSIISQISFKGDTDLDLLYGCIEPNLADRDFFIRKAIGWALRQYAWIDPAEIVRYVEANKARLSPLSEREALKNVNR